MTTSEIELVDQDYQMVDVASMRPHPDNPNQGDEQFLATSINETGFFGAVLLRDHPDEEGVYQILGGEHRWRHAARHGQAQLPAIIIADCDDVQALKIMYFDNEVTRRGTYVQDRLDKVLDALGPIEGLDNVLSAAGARKDAEDDEEATKRAGEANDGEEGDEKPYFDDSDDNSGFVQEWGILVMAESELEQQTIFESLAKTFGASKLRVVSI